MKKVSYSLLDLNFVFIHKLKLKYNMKQKKNFLLFSILLLVGNTSGYTEVQNKEEVPSSKASDFTLTDSNGNAHKLSDYEGKYVVLEWVNHECPFVKRHYDSGDMQQLQKEFTERGVIWLSINSGACEKPGHWTPERAKEETEAKGAHPTAALLDEDGTVGKLYGAKTTPHMYVINPEGILIYQGAIDNNPLGEAKGPNYVNYVRAALEAAMEGEEVFVSQTKPYGCSVKYADQEGCRGK